jgi:chromosome segregation ATPase
MEENKSGEKIKLEDIHEMMTMVMKRLDKLDVIEDKLKTFEHDIKEVKRSVEFAHADIDDLKTDNQTHKATTEEKKQRLQHLEKENIILRNSVIDLKARSMRDNLIFSIYPKRTKKIQRKLFMRFWKTRLK